MKKLNDPEGFRTCWKCKTLKPTTEFHKNPNNVWGLSGVCKVCKYAQSVAYNKANPEKVYRRGHEYYIKHLEERKAYRELHREEKNAYFKKYRLENLDKLKSNLYERKYGITLKEFNSKLRSQDGKCAICQKPTHHGKGGFAVDHNHVTGAVRGILCGHCNGGLGHFKDNIQSLHAAIKYLESWM